MPQVSMSEQLQAELANFIAVGLQAVLIPAISLAIIWWSAPAALDFFKRLVR